jgi:hypothetical protein
VIIQSLGPHQLRDLSRDERMEPRPFPVRAAVLTPSVSPPNKANTPDLATLLGAHMSRAAVRVKAACVAGGTAWIQRVVHGLTIIAVARIHACCAVAVDAAARLQTP